MSPATPAEDHGARTESEARLAALVRAAVRRHAQVRCIEAGVLGLAAGGICFAGALLAGSAPDDSGAWLASLLGAVFCGVTWSLERYRSPAELVRRLDRETSGGGLGAGALETAVECAERDSNPLERALIDRAAGAVAPEQARRAIGGPAIALLAAPLVAGAAVSFLLERGPGHPGEPPELTELRVALAAAGLEPRALGDNGAPGDPNPDERGAVAGGETEELLRLAERALASAGSDPRADMRADMWAGAEREQALRALAAGLEERGGATAGSERAALERAAALARSLAPDRTAASAGDPPGQAGGRGGGAGAPAPAGPGTSERALAAGGSGATMEGSADEAESSGAARAAPPVPAADPGDDAGGAVLGRTWDTRHDGVVSGWLERSRRRSSLNQPPGQR